MTLFRWIVGLPAAAMITAGLFFMMSEMIKDRGGELPPSKPYEKLVITKKIDDSDPTTIRPPRPVPADDQPPPILTQTTRSKLPTQTDVRPNPGPVKVDREGGTMPMGGPSIKIMPTYPEGCRSKGAEGVVVVEFDVTPEGNVTNLRVTSSPDRCFDRPIRNAVSKWKYPPASNNGRPAMRYGVVEVFNFQLVD